ncbi:MAG TPA: pantoate--beta-alanine ligase [Anaerolineales bacterium]|nr:pantoate--beta-alanine ligase [Anaerolineales bacterium]
MTRIVHTLGELRAVLSKMTGSIGLVPTMGFLHAGHLSLIHLSVSQNTNTVVSIFVNPTQFGPTEDLNKYPRDIDGDLVKINNAGECLVWIPDAGSMYADDHQTWVEVTKLTTTLEGAQRPGHFRGVTTIVSKLFNAVQPDKAYFGQKDLQQVSVIKRMVADLSYPIEIVVGKTIREADGLAMSSRNSYLNLEERKAAPILFRALSEAEKDFQQGERNASVLVAKVIAMIESEPLAQIQYVTCSDLKTLQQVSELTQPAAISLAVYFGKTRLIDNILLG